MKLVRSITDLILVVFAVYGAYVREVWLFAPMCAWLALSGIIQMVNELTEINKKLKQMQEANAKCEHSAVDDLIQGRR